MTLTVQFKGALEPQFAFTTSDPDKLRIAVDIIRRLNHAGLLYTDVENTTINMTADEYITID